MAQGLFGYTSFDAVQFFETIKFKTSKQRSRNSVFALQIVSIRDCD